MQKRDSRVIQEKVDGSFRIADTQAAQRLLTFNRLFWLEELTMTMTLKEGCERFRGVASDKQSVRDEIDRHLKVFVEAVGERTIIDPGLLAAFKKFSKSVDGMQKKNGERYGDSWKEKTRKYAKEAIEWFKGEGWLEPQPTKQSAAKPMKSKTAKILHSKSSEAKLAKKATAGKKPKSITAGQIASERDAPLSPDQEKLINEATAHINALAEKGSGVVFEIGQYLFMTFFDADPIKVEDKSPTKGVSIRKLAEHPDISLSYPSLWRALELAVNDREYRTDSSMNQLSASHKLVIFRIQDKSLWKRYIDQAAAQKLSVKRLRSLLETDGLLNRSGVEPHETEEERRAYRLRLAVAPIREFAEFNTEAFFKEFSDFTNKRFRTAAMDAIEQMKRAKKVLDGMIVSLDERLK